MVATDGSDGDVTAALLERTGGTLLGVAKPLVSYNGVQLQPHLHLATSACRLYLLRSSAARLQQTAGVPELVEPLYCCVGGTRAMPLSAALRPWSG